MSLVIEARGMSELDVDFSRATQLSTIGSLADGVLREIVVLELGALTPDQMIAVPRAASIFRGAATQYAQPRTIWDAHSVLDDIVHFSSPAPGAVSSSAVPQDDAVEPWLVGLADALEALMEPAPDPAAIGLVRREFMQISQSTMRSASRIVNEHSFFA